MRLPTLKDYMTDEEWNIMNSNQEWISVKDRLPGKDGMYLCYYKFPDGMKGCTPYYFTSLGEPRFKKDFQEEEITHWQPLPEPPNE